MKTNHEKHAVDEVKRQQYLKIKAKSIEYISDNGYGAGINYTTNIVVDIMTGFAFDEVTAATEEIKRERDEYYDTLQEYRLKTADMEKRIQELEAHVPKWISVEERLPDDENMNVIFMKLDGKWNKSEIGSWHKFKYFREYELKHEYTHWMPLPQPIK